SYRLVGAIDPYYERSPRYEALKAAGVPFYQTLEDFYGENYADLVLIVSPVHLHLEQCITAMRHGSDVLCEKPLTPLVQDVALISAVQRETGRRLGVGFQLSFSLPMLALKRDIQSGLLGAPKSLSCCVSWPRYDSYYDSSWHGHLRDANGNWVLDSILSNATAHYLHNICFVLGNRTDAAALPETLSVELYNGKGIETFDTAFLRGRFSNGCALYLALTHSGEETINPIFQYEFEDALVTARPGSGGAELVAYFSDGSTKSYGILGEDQVAQKLRTMLAAAADPALEVPCTPETIRPQLTITNAIFDQAHVHPLPGMVHLSDPEPGLFRPGLSEEVRRCFDQRLLPSELGLDWAAAPDIIPLAGYTAFSGARFVQGGFDQ
ncbi:MAG: Gfo/Idh/MocA family protein, partial [Candidatus Onthomonas sp.]